MSGRRGRAAGRDSAATSAAAARGRWMYGNWGVTNSMATPVSLNTRR